MSITKFATAHYTDLNVNLELNNQNFHKISRAALKYNRTVTMSAMASEIGPEAIFDSS
jgi:hypothetical protein